MKVAVLSTSSPRAAVAILDGGSVLAFGGELAPRQAEAALFRVLARALDEAGLTLPEVEGFIADIGPGSFTGVRVGVTVAKTLAWAQGVKVAGISSFDLISDGAVAVPSRRNLYLLRAEAEASPTEVRAEAMGTIGLKGYGSAFVEQQYPDPRRAALHLNTLTWLAPEELLPWYVLEPGISSPKTPFRDVSE
jgi:tRNA threonylcarbamoyladenosine biosynthesis protein TsaB